MTHERKAEALLPCPFCGNPASMGRDGKAYTVECSIAGCITGAMYGCDEDEAIAKWNCRYPKVGVYFNDGDSSSSLQQPAGRISDPAFKAAIQHARDEFFSKLAHLRALEKPCKRVSVQDILSKKAGA